MGRSLQFALNGDDWQALYFYLLRFTTFSSHFDINNFFATDVSNYTFAHIIMGLIYRLFSYNPFPYFLISMILRIITAVSFYPAVAAATKNKVAGYLSAIFFASMFAGIETTNWVFNMNTYVSLSFMNLFIFIYFSKDQKVFSITTFFLSVISFAIFFSAPTRMHGFLIILPLILLTKVRHLNIYSLKKLLIESLFFYLPILIVRYLTLFKNDKNLVEIFSQILKYDKSVFSNLLATLGNSFIPDRTLAFFVGKSNSETLFISVLYIVLIIFFYKTRKKYLSLTQFGLASLIFPIAFLIIPWLINPNAVLSSDHRYQIIPGAYIMVIFAIFISILWQSKMGLYKSIAILLAATIILVNFFTLRNYFDFLSKKGRLAQDVERQFNFIKSQIDKPNPQYPTVFLFIPDDPFYLYNAVTFGFQYHWMVIDPRFGMDYQKSPFPADNIDSLIDVLSGPESKELKRYGYKPVKIPIENVYAFTLNNKNLSNVSEQVRDTLKKKLSSF